MSNDTLPDEYTLTVTFTRSRAEDVEVSEATGRTLVEQLAAELREAYAFGLLSGSFKVTT